MLVYQEQPDCTTSRYTRLQVSRSSHEMSRSINRYI